MRVAVPKEITPGERRVALVPDSVSRLVRSCHEVVVQSGAGEGALVSDEEYREAGASIEPDVAAHVVADPGRGGGVARQVRDHVRLDLDIRKADIAAN